MNKQLQINLFLARAMGLDHARFATVSDGVDQEDCILQGRYPIECRVEPHTDKAQWAEVILWAWKHGTDFTGDKPIDQHYYGEPSIEFGNTDESIMAGILEKIAIILGWEEKK